jgi:hypothetical protein
LVIFGEGGLFLFLFEHSLYLNILNNKLTVKFIFYFI